MTDIMDLYPGQISPEPNSGCWLWTAALRSGYAALWDGYGHQLSRRLRDGDDGKWTLHKCDVRSCVNPDHLYGGDLRSNLTDALSRNRIRRGERHGMAKLTADQAALVKEYSAKPQKWGFWSQLAREWGVSPVTICCVKTQRNWKAASHD